MECKNNIHEYVLEKYGRVYLHYKCKNCSKKIKIPIYSKEECKIKDGSTFDGVAYTWDAEKMSFDDVNRVTVYVDDFPPNSAIYTGDKLIVTDVSANSKKEIVLLKEEKCKLDEYIKSFRFCAEKQLCGGFVPLSDFDIIIFEFSNGSKFCCMKIVFKEIYGFMSLVRQIANLKKTMRPNPDLVDDYEPLPGVDLNCCKISVPAWYVYCPKCGKLIKKSASTKEIFIDSEVTLVFCPKCNKTNRGDGVFCVHCGHKIFKSRNI